MQEPRAATRSERKEATRQAILDAALLLSADTGLAGLSLRSVAKAVGIVPTAFYRHFASIEELGIALVDEAFASLRQVLRDLRREMDVHRGSSPTPSRSWCATSASAAGTSCSSPVSGSAGCRRCGRRSGTSWGCSSASSPPTSARLPGVQEWTAEDLRVLANLIVGSMVETAEAIITAPPARPDIEREIQRTAETQLRMVVIGAVNWRSKLD